MKSWGDVGCREGVCRWMDEIYGEYDKPVLINWCQQY